MLVARAPKLSNQVFRFDTPPPLQGEAPLDVAREVLEVLKVVGFSPSFGVGNPQIWWGRLRGYAGISHLEGIFHGLAVLYDSFCGLVLEMIR